MQQSWFVLPPIMEYYYKSQNPFYKTLPKFREDCIGEELNTMNFIYPSEKSTIFLPKDFNGKQNELIVKVAHTNKNSTLYWSMNNEYIATTKGHHEIALLPKNGNYTITVVDNFGNEIEQKITIKN